MVDQAGATKYFGETLGVPRLSLRGPLSHQIAVTWVLHVISYHLISPHVAFGPKGAISRDVRADRIGVWQVVANCRPEASATKSACFNGGKSAGGRHDPDDEWEDWGATTTRSENAIA